MGRKYLTKTNTNKKTCFLGPNRKGESLPFPPFFRGKLAVSFREGNVLTSLTGALNVRRYCFVSPRGKETRIQLINVPMPKKAQGQTGKKKRRGKVLRFFVLRGGRGKCKSKKVGYGGMESS